MSGGRNAVTDELAGEDRPKRERNAKKSRQAILNAAKSEFCLYGFSGARVERIARKSKANMRMIYHYFGSKEGVYLAVLETIYGEIREGENKLDLTHAEPLEGIRKLIGFTFDFFAARRDVLALINSENTMKGRFLKRLPHVQAMTLPLVETIRGILDRGQGQGVFRGDVDPVQLYVSIVALSQLHLLSQFTLSVIFAQDLSDPDWLAQRRVHIERMLVSYLTDRNAPGPA